MTATWSYKTKFKVTALALLLLGWVAYRFAVVQTLEIKEEISTLQDKLDLVDDAANRMNFINGRLRLLDQSIGDYSGVETTPRLISFAGSYCEDHGLVLAEIPEKHHYASDEYDLVTYRMVVSGPFKGLIQLLHRLETEPVAGKIQSAGLELYDNNGRSELLCTYYLQAIGKHPDVNNK